MIALTLGDVASLCGGSLSPEADAAALVTGAVADSRRVAPGSLFVAVTGEHVDGHDFATHAVAFTTILPTPRSSRLDTVWTVIDFLEE